jgi:hypothetical protein
VFIYLAYITPFLLASDSKYVHKKSGMVAIEPDLI